MTSCIIEHIQMWVLRLLQRRLEAVSLRSVTDGCVFSFCVMPSSTRGWGRGRELRDVSLNVSYGRLLRSCSPEVQTGDKPSTCRLGL